MALDVADCRIVRLLREELQLLHEPGSYVGEVVKVMGKTKVLVKVQPEGKYSAYPQIPSVTRAYASQSSTSTVISMSTLSPPLCASPSARTRTPSTRSCPTRSTRSYRS